MSTNSLEQLKQAKSTLQAERKPVSQVQEAVKETKKITQFVNGALSKENRWIFQAGEQESIVSMLADITRTNKDLYNKCRTPDHFDRDANRFLKMKHQIIRQAECIHFSLDQGFYATEPRGFSAGKAIELSLKKIREIRDGHQQGKWTQLPIEANVDDSAKNEVEKIFTEATSLAEKLLKNNNISNFDPPMTVEEVQSVYKFFQNVHQIQELEQQALIDALSKKTTAEQSSPNEILDNLSSFERKLKNIRIPTSKNIPDWGLELYEMSRTDMTLRMHLLRIPFEPLGFLNRHLKKLEEQKERDGIEKSITSFHDYATQELKHLQLFIETFGGFNETLREITGILQNLSICFGKIYHNASSDTLTSVFLVKALGLIKGMLEKGGRVAASKNQTLQKIRQSVNDVNLFDAPITEGIFHALELLEQGEKEMSQYCNRISKFLDTLSSASDWDSMKTYSLLQEAYNENASLTSASMIFDSVAQTCVLLVKTIKEVESKWNELGKIRVQNQDTVTLYEQTVSFLRQNPEFTEKSLKQSSDQVEELDWILDEMLGQGALEELRFVDELRSELKPVVARAKAQRIKTKGPEQKSGRHREAQEQRHELDARQADHRRGRGPAAGTARRCTPYERAHGDGAFCPLGGPDRDHRRAGRRRSCSVPAGQGSDSHAGAGSRGDAARRCCGRPCANGRRCRSRAPIDGRDARAWCACPQSGHGRRAGDYPADERRIRQRPGSIRAADRQVSVDTTVPCDIGRRNRRSACGRRNGGRQL